MSGLGQSLSARENEAGMRAALLCELPGWSGWLAQHQGELTAEELGALLAWRVVVRCDAGPVDFAWFLVQARQSLAQLDAQGEPDAYPQPYTRSARR